MANVAVIGAGYVGLAVAGGLSQFGHSITVLDVDPNKVAALNAGEPLVWDKPLSEALAIGRRAGLISATLEPETAVRGRDAVFICVGTPSRADGDADLTSLDQVCLRVAALLEPGALVVLKSTVPIGSFDFFRERVVCSKHPAPILVHCPEFLREGSALEDFLHPDRIVIGTTDPRGAQRLLEIYAGIEAPVVLTDPVSAQIIKYGANALLALKISYINLIAQLCEAEGGEIQDVSRGIGLDRGIDPSYLNAGLGFGGPCLPKDLRCLIRSGERLGIDMALLHDCDRINRDMVTRVVDQLSARLGTLSGKRIGLWGLAFKPATADLRDSQSLRLAELLLQRGGRVVAWDPAGCHPAAWACPGLVVAQTMWEAVDGQDALVVATEWPDFGRVSLQDVSQRLGGKVLLDCRRVIDATVAASAGLHYLGIGYGGAAPMTATARHGGGPAVRRE